MVSHWISCHAFPAVLAVTDVDRSFPHMLECCMWSSYFPFHSQPVLVHWMSSLAVIPSSTIFTFSVVPLEITWLQSGQSGRVGTVSVLLGTPGNRSGHMLGLPASAWLTGFENKGNITISHQSHYITRSSLNLRHVFWLFCKKSVNRFRLTHL